MTPFERLKTLVEWNLSDNVKEEDIKMDIYMDDCGTSGCRAGWGATCPALIAEGYSLTPKDYQWDNSPCIDQIPVEYIDETFTQFFGLTEKESSSFFAPYCSGTKDELRKTWKNYLQGINKNI